MSGRRLRARKDLTTAPPSDPPITRPRRGTTSATVDRSPEDSRGGPGIRITVKAPPSKLREATSGTTTTGRRGNNVSVNSRDTFEGGEIVVGARAARKKAIVEESSEEEEEDGEEEEDDAGDEDMQDEEEDEDEDAEGEEDEEMIDAPPPPPPASKGRRAPISKPNISVTPAEPDPTLSTVEAKEMAMQDDEEDEELSSLSSQDELGENDEEEGGEEDAEGEDEEEEEEVGDEDADGEEEDDVDEDSDSDNETPGMGMDRSHTPDLSKLTRRQRAAFEEYEGGLMALSNEAQKKKHLTAEEHAMRRAEMARRRKNLSEKRNEEEKMDTINRLLKKQAPKRRGRAAGANADDADDEDIPRASKLYTRYVQSFEGVQLGVPDEWLDNNPVGEYLVGDGVRPRAGAGEKEWTGRMVEVVE